MKGSRLFRRALLIGGVAATSTAMIALGVTPPLGASTAGTAARGPGYPPPGGIYGSFTNCPLNNPVMHEVMPITESGGGFAACVAGLAVQGTVTLGTLTTSVALPVNVQFGFHIPPGDPNFYPAPVTPPLAGQSAILSTGPDVLPDSLTTALGCATATDPTILKLCNTATSKGGIYNEVYALAQEAGPITNFGIFTWTQAIKFQLINPLLGSSCYVGSNDSPVLINPSLTTGPGGTIFLEYDPHPKAHPDTFVLGISGAIASDTTFSAPGVQGCGAGLSGVQRAVVDGALDTGAGLPAASGTNTLTLDGSFLIAASTASEDSSLTQPVDDADILLSAFKASTKEGPRYSTSRHITMAQAKALLSPGG
jgi:hypothetical protein